MTSHKFGLFLTPFSSDKLICPTPVTLVSQKDEPPLHIISEQPLMDKKVCQNARQIFLYMINSVGDSNEEWVYLICPT